jgi:hypothetical protein
MFTNRFSCKIRQGDDADQSALIIDYRKTAEYVLRIARR